MTPRRARFLKRQWHLQRRAQKALRRAQMNRRRRRRVSYTPLAQPKVVSGQRTHEYKRTRLGLKVPKIFNLLDDPVEAIGFFDRLREAILVHPHRAVVIDHSSIEVLSPETGLVLIAELFRADYYAPRCRKYGTPAEDPMVAEIFQKIGYWEHFGISYNGPERSGRQFLIHRTGRRTSGSLVKSVIHHLSEVAVFTDSERLLLYEAFIECMDNVMNHAYPNAVSHPPVLVGQWWLLAYRDSDTKEVCLCFCDQGLGIPDTIRTRLQHMLPFIRPSDANLIAQAVEEGQFSKHDLPTRGNGLPTLKAFVDESRDGELRVVSRFGYCVFKHGQPPETKILTKPFEGTLIVWKLYR